MPLRNGAIPDAPAGGHNTQSLEPNDIELLEEPVEVPLRLALDTPPPPPPEELVAALLVVPGLVVVPGLGVVPVAVVIVVGVVAVGGVVVPVPAKGKTTALPPAG